MKTTIIFLIIFCTSEFSHSQLIENWSRRYNGLSNTIDMAVRSDQDIDKNTYVTGISFSPSSLNDYATVKYSSSGIQEWVKLFNGTANEYDYATGILTIGSDIYVTGYSFGIGTSYDYATVKYNSSGTQQWVARFNGAGGGNDGAYAISADNVGNIYITGESYGGTVTSYDFLTLKYNSSGVLLWESRYNGTGNGNDAAYALAVDNFNNIYVTGKSIGIGTNLDYATVKYNSDGQQQWVSRFDGTAGYLDVATTISVSNTGLVTVSGHSSETNTGYDLTTIGYDGTSGHELWVSKFNGTVSGNDMPSAMKIDNSGFIYLAGVTNTDVGGSLSDYITLKYNSSGVLQWSSTYDGAAGSNDSASSLAVDLLGNVFVTGKSKGIGSSFDYVTNQYNSSGILQYSSRYSSSGSFSDVATCINIDELGNTYVTGNSVGSSSEEDYLTIKYTRVSAINTLSTEIPDKFELTQNYPNPFNPSTNIIYSITSKGIAKLRIVSIGGNEIETLVDEYQNPGTYSVKWNAEQYPSGIYYYSLDTEGFTATKKMILIK